MQNTMHSTLIFYYKSSLKEIRKCITTSMCILDIYFLYFSSINDARRDLHVKHELIFKAPEFIPVSGGFRDARSLALCAIFVDRWLSFCPVNFGIV
jgi:hypothetical protein